MRPKTAFAYILRGAAFLFGCYIVLKSIFIALIGGAAPSDTVPTVSPLLTVPLIGFLMASGFFYVAVLGQRLANSRLRYRIAGLLLAVPLASGISLLATPEEQMLHATGFFLAAPACLLLLCAIWPLRLISVPSRPDDGSK
ncbi:hypothetical protein [Massilia luteola]|uniref:hypothetical protein n=1 Tax=Massilia luteola TaxID=3081751 RepID=UPI002ACC3037|nr:hypothetical protein [Massilia sp. Gc5]